MAVFESLFDVMYLSVVIALGARLMLEKKPGAKLFGLMALLLGAGDAFHLLPRVISHLSPLGFSGHVAALSWGRFVTGVTMTVFYVLFYHFYRERSGDTDGKKRFWVYALALLRLILLVMPQNNWGGAEGNSLFAIYRNIPFAVLGCLLVVWCRGARGREGLQHMWALILLSFLFYLPVVLWSRRFPAVGALMMPKTVAYLAIVALGYRYFVGPFTRVHLLGTALANLVMGLAGGVFYREFTKAYRFDGLTHLGKVHAHALVLGVGVMLVCYLLSGKMDESRIKRLKKSVYLFEAGLVLTLACMLVIGIDEIIGAGAFGAALDGLSGLGHILLAAGMAASGARLFQSEKETSCAA